MNARISAEKRESVPQPQETDSPARDAAPKPVPLAKAAPVAESEPVEAATADRDAEDADERPNWRRRILLGAAPVAVAIAALAFWLSGGRYVSTEDAYVKTDKVVLSAELSGPIDVVEVRENQPVAAGQVLFRIDERPYRIALAGAEAELAATITEFAGIKVSFRQKSGELQLAVTNREFAEREFTRQSVLAKNKMNSGAALDESGHALDIARQEISVTEQERAQYLARLNGDPELPVERFPAYLAAKAKRDQAALDLERTVVRAPFAGIASKVPQRQQFAMAGSAVMSVVATQGAWVEANFMETELTEIRAGQPVAIEIDAYPGREWHGQVKSISQATGAEFSILPPQNASGNWVKITQRVPVRIAVDVGENDPPLRAGMTATVEVDTGKQRSLHTLFGAREPAGDGTG